MTRRSRRNPTGAGIDMNSALLGAGVGAIAVYLLTKKSETAPGQGAYLPAGAPADEPWMRAMGYKKGSNNQAQVRTGISIRPDTVYEDAPARYFSLDAKFDKAMFWGKLQTPLEFIIRDINGDKQMVSAKWMQDGRWRDIGTATWAQAQLQEFLRTGVSRQPGADGYDIVFGELKPIAGPVPGAPSTAFQQPEGRGVPNSSESLREGFVVTRPQMRSAIPNAMLRWK